MCLLIPEPCLCPEFGTAIYIRPAEDVSTPQSVQETCLGQVWFKAQLRLDSDNMFLPAITKLEPRMSKWGSVDEEVVEPVLGPNKQAVSIWYHNESIFYAHDC